MNKLILFSIPIAASNSFGFVRFSLVQLGILDGVDNLFRYLFFFLAVGLAFLISVTRNKFLGWAAVVLLSLAAVFSAFGIWLGIRFSSPIAILLAVLWSVVFSLAAFKLPKVYIGAEHAKQ